jgi:hypothetical protein
MYLNDSGDQAHLRHERILAMLDQSKAEECLSDPQAREAFEKSLRILAEDIIKHNPSLAHILLGVKGEDGCEFNGRN